MIWTKMVNTVHRTCTGCQSHITLQLTNFSLLPSTVKA